LVINIHALCHHKNCDSWRVEQMREALSRLSLSHAFLKPPGYPKSDSEKQADEALTTADDTSSILAERDARTLRMAADICKDEVIRYTKGGMVFSSKGAGTCEKLLRAKADEQAKGKP